MKPIPLLMNLLIFKISLHRYVVPKSIIIPEHPTIPNFNSLETNNLSMTNNDFILL